MEIKEIFTRIFV